MRKSTFKILLTHFSACFLFLAATTQDILAQEAPSSEGQQDFTATGELITAVAEDFASGSARIDYLLKVSENEVYKLHGFTPSRTRSLAHSTLQVKGRLLSDEEFGKAIQIAEMAVTAQAEIPEKSPQTDVRRAVLFRVNFADAAVECSAADIAGLMWTGAQNIDGLYQESSFGNVSFNADTDANGIADVFDVTISNTVAEGTCSSGAWASAANEAAQAQGVDLSIYQHKMYVLPRKAPCSWAGYAYIGCWSSCTSWVRTCSIADVYAHELGHNLSMRHSSTDTDNDGEVDSEYGDYSCIMGIGGVGWRHFNAVQKEIKGWIPQERVMTLVGNIETDIAVTELNPTASVPAPSTTIQLLKIGIPNEENWNYYLSFRAPYGNYSNRLRDTYKNKVNIHRRSDYSNRTLFLGAIDVGESWSDSNGINVSFESRPDDYTARVQVIMPPVRREGAFPNPPTELKIKP